MVQSDSTEMNQAHHTNETMENLNMPPAWVKKRELAKLLGVSARTIDTWVAKRIIPYIAASPRLHLFDPNAVRKTLEGRFGIQSKSHGC